MTKSVSDPVNIPSHPHRACLLADNLAVLVAERSAAQAKRGIDGLAKKSVKTLHDCKYSSKRSEYLGFYLYLCHVCYDFHCL